ncbi:TPA: MFS transporter, partial [Escherichia coli]|nr:MFS transporter [Escherichia coli]
SLNIVKVGYLSAMPYLAAIILMLAGSYFSDKLQNRKLFIWPLQLIAGISFLISYVIGSDYFWISYSLLIVAAACMYAPYGPFFALIPELLPKNVSGASTGLINSFGALGSFVGAWVVGYLNGVTGDNDASFTLMAFSLIIAASLIFLLKHNVTRGDNHNS